MSHPAQPSHFQPQGPATSCVIDGKALGWLNCTPTSFAMATDQASLNRVRKSGCDFRESTGDITGGTTLAQNAPLAEAYGIDVTVHAGGNVIATEGLAWALQAGRGAVVQGNTVALIGTPQRSTGSGVNHAVFVSWVKGGTLGHPAEALVFDPAADGRNAGWGKADQGPTWWPWSLVLKFVSELRPWGDNDPRKLGPGRAYAAVFPDTEPHFHSKFKGVRTTPFPDRMTGRKGASIVARRVRPGPGTQYAPTGEVSVGELFVAYQWTNGQPIDNLTRWYGNHDGTQWVHRSGLSGAGGDT